MTIQKPRTESTRHRLTVRCPAKVNLGLEVLARRADGFHDVCTVLQTLDLYDELELRVVDGDGEDAPEVEVTGPFADEVPREGNSVLAAWAVCGGSAGYPKLAVRLTKRIPSGAGLGGGSSDAAGMLLAMRELRRLLAFDPVGEELASSRTDGETTEVDASTAGAHKVLPYEYALNPGPTQRSDLPGLALRIGSDVPFFLHGGCALGEGRGEQLTPVARMLPLHLVVGIPEFASPTASAYGALGRGAEPRQPGVVPQLARALAGGDLQAVAAGMVNDFEPHLLTRYPAYRDWFSLLTAQGALAVGITGSGSGFIGLFADASATASAARQLGQLPGLRYAGAHRAV